MGGQKHSLGFANLSNQPSNLLNLVGIQATRGFVENENVRVMNHGLGQAHPLLEAFGECANALMRAVFEVAAVEHPVDRPLGLSRSEVPNLSNEPQVIPPSSRGRAVWPLEDSRDGS